MTPTEAAYFVFDFYEQIVEKGRGQQTRYRSASEVARCCDVDAKSDDTLSVSDLQWAMGEVHGSHFVSQLKNKYHWFEKVRITHNPHDVLGSIHDSWDGDERGSASYSGGSMRGRQLSQDAALSKHNYAEEALVYPVLIEPITQLQCLFANAVIDPYFWGHLHERALRAKCSRSYEAVFERHHQRRLSRLDTQLSNSRLLKGVAGARGAATAGSTISHVAATSAIMPTVSMDSDGTKLTARTAGDNTPREDSISTTLNLSRQGGSGLPPPGVRTKPRSITDGRRASATMAVHLVKGEAEAHRRNTVDNSQLTEASLLLSKEKRAEHRKEKYSFTPDFFGPDLQYQEKLRCGKPSGTCAGNKPSALSALAPEAVSNWKSQKGKAERKQKMRNC